MPHAVEASDRPMQDAVRGMTTNAADVPLIVDLDGTLLRTDMLQECALRLLHDRPLAVASFPAWLASGKAVLKRRIAERVEVDARHLPYHLELVAWLTAQRAAGRMLVLCTASDALIADAVAAHLGIFDRVIASDGVRNLAGLQKAEALDAAFGRGAYDYVGNSFTDLPVWAHARRAIVVDGSDRLLARARAQTAIERVFPRSPIALRNWRQVLRMHQWLKNALLFVPLLAAHQIGNLTAWATLIVAFLAFSICASSVYIANDLLDLDSDRQHPRKRNRPFASGTVAVAIGVFLAPLLLVLAGVLAIRVGPAFFGWLTCYFLVTCAYSWSLKRHMIVDCLTLAILYTLRIIAGAAAIGMPLSFWLLAFSVFLFLSLAFVKRYAELEVQADAGNEKAHGRGYYTSDAPLIQNLGTTAGYASVLVLALYLNSDAVLVLYRTPEVMWGTVPVMLFWVSWMWMQAHRGQMHDDPLVFAVKDRASQLTGVVFGAILVLGAVGWPW